MRNRTFHRISHQQGGVKLKRSNLNLVLKRFLSENTGITNEALLPVLQLSKQLLADAVAITRAKS